MNEVSENIQLLLDDILLFHEELERVFAKDGLYDCCTICPLLFR